MSSNFVPVNSKRGLFGYSQVCHLDCDPFSLLGLQIHVWQ